MDWGGSVEPRSNCDEHAWFELVAANDLGGADNACTS